MNIIKNSYNKDKDISNRISYRESVDKWRKDNPEFSYILDNRDDSFYSKLGAKILDILEHSDLTTMVLVGIEGKKFNFFYSLKVINQELMSHKVKNSVMSMPSKLPMICPPKPYSDDKLGGYLLNDDKYAKSLIVKRKAYALSSQLANENKLYCMVNKLSATPFKINKPLLDFINNNWEKYDLLLDPNAKHKYHDLLKRTKYQQSEYASHISKIVLQENILGIAEYYSRFSSIYFPLRLDQRGIIYCVPSYLNYQSNELSKSLLFFAQPGIIYKNNLSGIMYLKA